MGRYDDIKQIINQDFNNFLSENSFVKMTISGVVSKILEDFFVMIEYNEVEKIMFFTQLALQCAKRNYMKDDLKRNILDIIENNSLEAHKSEIDPEDFEAMKSDLEKVKHYITG